MKCNLSWLPEWSLNSTCPRIVEVLLQQWKETNWKLLRPLSVEWFGANNHTNCSNWWTLLPLAIWDQPNVLRFRFCFSWQTRLKQKSIKTTFWLWTWFFWKEVIGFWFKQPNSHFKKCNEWNFILTTATNMIYCDVRCRWHFHSHRNSWSYYIRTKWKEVFVCIQKVEMNCKYLESEVLLTQVKYSGRTFTVDGGSRSLDAKLLDGISARNKNQLSWLVGICRLLLGVYQPLCCEHQSKSLADEDICSFQVDLRNWTSFASNQATTIWN